MLRVPIATLFLIGIVGLVLSLVFFVAPDAFAQEGGRLTQMMVGVPGLDANGTGRTLPDYINTIYLFLITTGAIIGVIKIGIAGVKYATSDIISSKAEAKKDIQGVLLGLLILLTPYLVLTAINRNIVSLDVLKLEPIGGEEGLSSTLPNAPVVPTSYAAIRSEYPTVCGVCNLGNPRRIGGRTQCEALREICRSIGGAMVPKLGQEIVNECRVRSDICPPLPTLPPLGNASST